jgi:hypothetical protein
MRYLTVIAAAAVVLLAACSSSPSPSTTGTATHATAPAHSAAASAAAPRSLGAAVIAARMKAAGMPIRRLVVYTPSTDPNHMMGR